MVENTPRDLENSEAALKRANKLLQARESEAFTDLDASTEKLMRRVRRQLSTRDLISFGFARILHVVLVLFSSVHRTLHLAHKAEEDQTGQKLPEEEQ